MVNEGALRGALFAFAGRLRRCASASGARAGRSPRRDRAPSATAATPRASRSAPTAASCSCSTAAPAPAALGASLLEEAAPHGTAADRRDPHRPHPLGPHPRAAVLRPAVRAREPLGRVRPPRSRAARSTTSSPGRWSTSTSRSASTRSPAEVAVPRPGGGRVRDRRRDDPHAVPQPPRAHPRATGSRPTARSLVYATDHEPHDVSAGRRWRPRGRQRRRPARRVLRRRRRPHPRHAVRRRRATPSKVGWGHSPMEYAVDLAAAVGVRRLVLFHHDPSRDDDAARRRAVASPRRGGRRRKRHARGRRGRRGGRDRASRRPGRRPAPRSSRCRRPPTVPAARAPRRRAWSWRPTTPPSRSRSARRPRPRASTCAPLTRRTAMTSATRSWSSTSTTTSRWAPSPARLERARRHPPGDPAARAANVTDWLVLPCSIAHVRTKLHAAVLRRACRWLAAPLPAGRGAAPRRPALRSTSSTRPPEARFDRLRRAGPPGHRARRSPSSRSSTPTRQWFKSHARVRRHARAPATSRSARTPSSGTTCSRCPTRSRTIGSPTTRP